MSDISKQLRDRASELSDVGFFATAQEMRQAAADIAELTELVEAQKQEILELHDIRDQRDEWQRRAGIMRTWLESWDQWEQDFEGATEGEPYFLISFPEAAQWFFED